MRISISTSSISRKAGGLGPVVWALANEYSYIGQDVGLFSLWDAHVEEDCGEPDQRQNVFRRFGPLGLGYSFPLRRALINNHADIYHAHGVWMYPTCASRRAAILRSSPLIISPHGMLDSWALANSKWRKKIVAKLYANANLRSAACIHALCESEYQSIRCYGLRNPVAIIPNGIDLPQQGAKLRPPWDNRLASDRKVMLFLGRIHPKKGLPNLIDAWAQLKVGNNALVQKWVLAIAGWSQGGHEEQLKKMVSDNGLGDDVTFLGPVFDDRKRACLKNARAFVLPSVSEGMPMSVLEAWSHGLPVMMTAQCNIPEGFGAGAAIEIRPEVESIKHGLARLLSVSDAERREMGLRGRSLIACRFSWPQIAAQMIDVYKWCINGGTPPSCVILD